MKSLWGGPWSSELVLGEVKWETEVDLIRENGIDVLWLKDIIRELGEKDFPVPSASGTDFIDLLSIE